MERITRSRSQASQLFHHNSLLHSTIPLINVSNSEIFERPKLSLDASARNQAGLSYDPYAEIVEAHEYSNKRKLLRFYQIFRFANALDWFLMVVGMLLAVFESFIVPWMYYWGSVAIHDVLIFERCDATTHTENGKEVCDIPNYCGITMGEMGERILTKILWAWASLNIAQFGCCMCFNIAAEHQTKRMRSIYFESIVRKDMAWFDLFADKDFANEMSDQVTRIRSGIGETIPNFCSYILSIISMVVIIFYVNYKAAISFLSFLPICIIVLYLGNWAEKRRTSVSDKMFEKAGHFAQENLMNIKVVKMYEAEKRQEEKFNELLDAKNDIGNLEEIKWMALAAVASGLIWLLLNIATSLVFWFGQKPYMTGEEFCDYQKHLGIISSQEWAHFVVGDLDLQNSPGEILLLYFGLTYITLHAIEVHHYWNVLKIARQNAHYVYYLIDWKSRIDNISKEGKTPKRSAVGRIDFQNVTFRYPRKPNITVLNIRQLTIYSGQFVGPEDSGKNTILKLIPRLYDTCSGFISLDSVNLQSYNIHWLRRQMCIISEAPVIFTGTVAENIIFGKLDATQDEIEKACKLAEVHWIIEKLPNGYNTTISSQEFGDHLTRNQKRQLCLARAYLHRSRLILLDNPIQPEDDELESLVLNFVNYFRETTTVILASTNITALSKRADYIYYMEHGKIIESGTHVELIQANGSYCNRLEGTMNLTLETRNKFESQLKAYKYSHLLHKKRKSSVENLLENSHSLSGVGDVPGGPKKRVLNFLKLLSFGDKSTSKDLNPEAAEREGEDARKLSVPILEEKDSKDDTKLKSILRRSRQYHELTNTSKLVEAYNRYHSVKSTSLGSGDYMHQGFGIMGFQRLNFAHPMTSYSIQLRSRKYASTSYFPDVGLHANNMLRQVKLPSTPSGLKSEDDEKGHTHVRFSAAFEDPHDKAHEEYKKPHSKKDIDGLSSSSTTIKTVKISLANLDDMESVGSTEKIQAKKKKGKLSRTNILSRQSVMDALKTLTHPTSFHLNEHIELDNVSIASQDLDSFLSAYDEGVYGTLNSRVKGFWRDVFFVVEIDWPYIVPAIISSIILGMSIPYQTWVIGTFFQAIGNNHVSENAANLEVRILICYMATVGAIAALAAFAQEFFFSMAGRKMTRRLRKRLFAHLIQQDLTWFDEKSHDIGVLIYQLLYADTMIVHFVLLTSCGILVQATFIAVTSIVIAAIETMSELAIVTICFMVLMPFLVGLVFLSTQMELRQSEHLEETFRESSNFRQEFLVNIKTWFSLGAESFFISQHNKILDKQYKYVNIKSVLISCFHTIVQTSSWLLYGIFIYVTLKRHIHGNERIVSTMDEYPTPLTKPTLVGFIIIATELLIFGAYRVGDQITIFSDIHHGKNAAHKIMRILITEPETSGSKEQLPEDDYYESPPEIGLTNIIYHYPGTDLLLRKPQLNNVSLTIASSSYVAIVGPPGSGKSTLCNIIVRMINPTSGILDFNGDDSYNINPKITRRMIGLVEYDPCLFEFSILENIRFSKCRENEETSRAEIEEAAKLSNCHFEILDLKDDYNTHIKALEKTAQNFSLKQRISYSRALLRNPKILLVDDATTSVDTESDHKILEALSNARDGRTLVVFSHKIDPIRDADMIFVLWEGEIVESGTDSFLLQKRGYYYEMYMTQKVLAESMRRSPQQLSTIRYNVNRILKRGRSAEHSNTSSPVARRSKNKLEILEDIAHKPKGNRKSSAALETFLDEKVTKIKEEKKKRIKSLEKELAELEKEERVRRATQKLKEAEEQAKRASEESQKPQKKSTKKQPSKKQQKKTSDTTPPENAKRKTTEHPVVKQDKKK